jgi:hypothetical protein
MAPENGSGLARIKEYFESEGDEGQDKVSIWTPRVSIAVERNTRGHNVSIKVRDDDPHEAVKVLDWLHAELSRRYPETPKP